MVVPSLGIKMSLLAKVKFCILENSSMSNLIYHRAIFLVIEFVHFLQLRLNDKLELRDLIKYQIFPIWL